MKVLVRDVCAAIEQWAPPEFCYSWDKAGLHTGAPGQEVGGVLTCLTVDGRALKAAGKARANMIVSHHPLVWEPLEHLRTDEPHRAVAVRAAAEGIACYSAHTNLDVAENGVNHTLARALDLKDLAPLTPAPHADRQVKVVSFVPETHLAAVRDAMAVAGGGVVGDYTHCSFSMAGTGTFKPGTAAEPWSGKKGRVNEEPERRIEMLAPKPVLPAILRALFESHPYEEVAYDVIPLENAAGRYGLGVRGSLSAALSLGDFAGLVRRALKANHVRVVGNRRRRVRTVGVLGGDGGGALDRISPDLDVVVTGDVTYHDA